MSPVPWIIWAIIVWGLTLYVHEKVGDILEERGESRMRSWTFSLYRAIAFLFSARAKKDAVPKLRAHIPGEQACRNCGEIMGGGVAVCHSCGTARPANPTF